MLNHFRSWPEQQFVPAITDKGRKSNGRSFPAGKIPGYEFYLENQVLLKLACLFNAGCKDIPNGWSFALDNLF